MSIWGYSTITLWVMQWWHLVSYRSILISSGAYLRQTPARRNHVPEDKQLHGVASWASECCHHPREEERYIWSIHLEEETSNFIHPNKEFDSVRSVVDEVLKLGIYYNFINVEGVSCYPPCLGKHNTLRK